VISKFSPEQQDCPLRAFCVVLSLLPFSQTAQFHIAIHSYIEFRAAMPLAPSPSPQAVNITQTPFNERLPAGITHVNTPGPPRRVPYNFPRTKRNPPVNANSGTTDRCSRLIKKGPPPLESQVHKLPPTSPQKATAGPLDSSSATS
jgi:hypothetical protein